MRVFTVLTLSTIIFAFLGVMIEQRDASSAKGKSEPKWKSLSEGLATAKSQNRKIMMDVYTDGVDGARSWMRRYIAMIR